MTRIRTAAVALALAAAVLLIGPGAPRAGAQTGSGELGPGSVRATARDLGSGSFVGSGIPARQPAAESLFTWTRQGTSSICVQFGGPVPPELAAHLYAIAGPTVITDQVSGPGTPMVPAGVVALDDPALLPPGATAVGDLVTEVGESGTTIVAVPRCVQPGDPLLGEPPSPAEIWQETPLPRATVHASPPGTIGWPGITRLATYFWGDALADTGAAVSLRGFDVTVVARPIAYAWSFGDGTTAVVADPGSATAPLRVTFLRRGDYLVDLYVVWEGRAHVSFAGFGVADVDLGTVTLPERAPYHVAEVRALLHSSPRRH
jgi:hypothetical protein